MQKDYVPFRDPQEVRRFQRCGRCGREVYGPAGCLYCQVHGA